MRAPSRGDRRRRHARCRARTSQWSPASSSLTRSRSTSTRTPQQPGPPTRSARSCAVSSHQLYHFCRPRSCEVSVKFLNMAVFLRKLLGLGKLPDEMRAEVEVEGIVHLTEFVAVTRRFTGKVPGKRSKGDIASYVGSLVLTNQRVLGTLSSVPKLAGR